MGQNNKGITRGELEGRVIELLKAHSEKDSSPIAIAINGNWGVGKSYMYRESLAVKIREVLGREPIYASVFGKKDENAIIQDLVAQFLKNNEVLDSLKSVVDCVGKIGLSLMRLPSANLGFILDFFKKKELKNTIVCIDDFERLSDKIPMQDILGLISELKENKGCHIILLCSEDHIGAEQKSVFYHYKEKIIDFDFFYNPMPMEQLRIFEGSQEYERYVAKIKDFSPNDGYFSAGYMMDRFQITNLREIRKLIFYFNSYCEQLGDLLDESLYPEPARNIFLNAVFMVVILLRVFYCYRQDEKLAKDCYDALARRNFLSCDNTLRHNVAVGAIEEYHKGHFMYLEEWRECREKWFFSLFDNNIPEKINDMAVEKEYMQRISDGHYSS